MVVYCVNVFVVEGKEQEFIHACIENRKGTRKEAGNIRFDVLQMADTPSQFLLYEVYQSENSVKAHKETSHYRTWREVVAPLMEKPREGVKYIPLSEF